MINSLFVQDSTVICTHAALAASSELQQQQQTACLSEAVLSYAYMQALQSYLLYLPTATYTGIVAPDCVRFGRRQAATTCCAWQRQRITRAAPHSTSCVPPVSVVVGVGPLVCAGAGIHGRPPRRQLQGRVWR
jgi:hypothetical protein